MAAAAAGKKFYRFKIKLLKGRRALNIEWLFEIISIHELS